ncbi:MAG: SRPBCC family protein [Dehalococcoidia bacterium]
MPSIRKSIEIQASPQEVFAQAVDPDKQPLWDTLLKRVEVVSGDGKSEGSGFRWTFKLGPRSQDLDAVVSEYKENQAYGRRVVRELSLRDQMLFSPSDDGTRLEWSIEYEPPLGLLGTAVDALFMNRIFQNDVEQSLENLKAQIEG